MLSSLLGAILLRCACGINARINALDVQKRPPTVNEAEPIEFLEERLKLRKQFSVHGR